MASTDFGSRDTHARALDGPAANAACDTLSVFAGVFAGGPNTIGAFQVVTQRG
ncbi:hypothetical protein ACFL5O_05915 [Myxococcota bacterium]